MVHPLDVFVITVDLVPTELETVHHSVVQHQLVELHPEQRLLCGAALSLDSRVMSGGGAKVVIATHHPHVIHILNYLFTPRL